MKLRVLSLVALALALAALAAWFWIGNERAVPSIRAVSPAAPDVTEVTTPAAPLASTPPAANQSDTPPRPITPPLAVVSSVVPGSPMVRSGLAPTPPSVVDLAAKFPVAPSSEVPTVEGKQELEKVQMMLRDFRTRMGGNPVGSNAEIMRAVMGGNPVQARLGPPQGQTLNADGELMDFWGTPYFFHQLSKEKMEIRSAGPDRKMWTPDDLVTK